MTTGERIKMARHNAHLTQRALAEKCDIATGTIQQYERGVRQPRMQQLLKISVALGVRLEDLIGLETVETGADFDKRWNELSQQVGKADREEQERLQQLTADFHKLNVHGQKEAVKRTSEMTRLPEFTEGRRMDIVVAHGADGKTTITDRKTGEKFVIDEEQDET